MRLCATGFVVFALGWASSASAQHVRRRFEPTDLELKPSGVAEVDVQFGAVRGDTNTRIYAPDFECSLGISSSTELAIDGSFGIDGASSPSFLDNTWVALRVGVFDVHDENKPKASWAGGIQAGPHLPTSPGATGLGLEGLAIVGRTDGPFHLFAQAGVIVDSAEKNEFLRPIRPFGIEGGFDASLDLDDDGIWSLTAELGGTRFFSSHDHQLHTTGGVAWQVTPWLELSTIAIVGLLPEGDRFGLLFGASPSFRVF